MGRILRTLACCLLLCGSAQAATRVALVTTCGGDVANVLALAQSRLSAEKDMVLVDRAEVERVLDEQKLWRCGLSDSVQALAAGKLLGVEVFAALETFSATSEALGLVVFDASSGVRLSDAVLPTGSPEKITEVIVATVRGACEKRQRAGGDRRTVCLLSVRNAELPREMDSFCESVGRMMERRLLGSASLAVLERDRLEQVNREHSLPTKADTGDLLASLTLLELEFGRAADGRGVKATAILTDAAGADLGKLSASADLQNAADLVEALLQELTKSLKATPVTRSLDRAREAQRFQREASFLSSQQDFRGALRSAEAACALDPANVVLRIELSKALISRGLHLVNPSMSLSSSFRTAATADELRASLELLHRALDMAHGVRDVQSIDRPLSRYIAAVLPSRIESRGYFSPSYEPSLKNYSPQIMESIRLLQSNWRARYFQMKEGPAYNAVKNADSFDYYAYCLIEVVIGPGHTFWEDAQQWAEVVVLLMTRWLDFAGKYDAVTSKRSCYLLTHLTVRTWGDWKLDDRASARMEQLWKRMEAHPDPYVRSYGRLGRMAADKERLEWSDDECLQRVRQFRLSMQEQIASSAAANSPALRRGFFLAAFDAMNLLPPPERVPKSKLRSLEATALCEFMLARQEIVGELLDDSSNGILHHPREAADCCRAYSVADQVISLLDSPRCQLLSGDRAFLRGRFNKIRELMLTRCPDLKKTGPKSLPVTRELVNLAGSNKDLRILHLPVTEGDSVYALGESSSTSGRLLQLQRWSFTDGGKTLLGKVALRPGDAHVLRGKDACIYKGTFYAAVEGYGIWMFATDGASTESLSTTNGLASDRVLSLACLDDKLFAGTADGYLISYDLDSRRCQLLASSRRKEIKSPFDGKPLFSVLSLAADPKRHRLVFLVSVPAEKRAMVAAGRFDAPLNGLWEFNTRSGTFKRLADVWITASSLRWAGKVRNDKIIFAGERGAFSFDLANDRIEVLYVAGYSLGGRGLMPWTPDVATAAATNVTPLTDGTLEIHPPYLILDGWLWSAKPFGRISLDGKRRQIFRHPDPDDEMFGVTLCMEPVADNRRLLVGHKYGLWLLGLPEE